MVIVNLYFDVLWLCSVALIACTACVINAAKRTCTCILDIHVYGIPKDVLNDDKSVCISVYSIKNKLLQTSVHFASDAALL